MRDNRYDEKDEDRETEVKPKFTLRLHPLTHEKLKARAKSKGMSMNQFIESLIMKLK